MAARNESGTADREIVIQRLINAPRELVFAAFTDPEHLKHWWGPIGFTTTTSRMEFRPGGVWRYVMHGPDGRDYQNLIQYDEIVRPERIVYRHGGGDDAEPIKFQSTITLAAKGERTEVTLHLVFDTPEERNHVVEKYGAIEGGNQTLGRLAEFVEKSGVAPEFILHRTFNAPRDVVYKAFTEEDRLAKWWGPKGLKMLHCKLDLRPGGLFHYGMSTPDGKEMWGKWLFREVQPPVRLVYVVSFSDKDGGTTRAPFNMDWPLEVLASVTFKDEGEKTTITMTSTPINATEAERKAFGGHFESMKAGFGGTLDQLDVFLANG